MYLTITGRYIESDLIGLAGGVNTYGYVGADPVGWIDSMGLDATIWTPLGAGRNLLDGPRNGNWGGGKWSGGVSGGGTGIAPPTDSADYCYMRHDKCYGSRPSKKSCDAKLVEELKSLPSDVHKWPIPPRRGTENATKIYLDGAILLFGR